MGPIHTLDDFIDMLRRRARLIVQVIVVGCLISVLYALSQQHMYTSTEVIQIARPKIADDLAPSTVAGSSARRLQLIEQRLTSRSSMLEIIDGFGLYAEYPDLKPSEMVDRLRRAVRIDGIAAAREGFADDGTMSVLSITAEMPTARQAQLVAHEFARRTIDLSTTTRIEQARETLAFFTAQETSLTAEVAALEEQIAAYRNTHDVSLPGSVEFRRDEIASINEALLDLDRESILIRHKADQVQRSERAATAKRKLADFDEQLNTLDAQRQLLQGRKAELEQSIETTPEVDRELGAFERQLQQLQAELDVISARRTGAEVGFRLEAERQAERLTVIEQAALPDYPITGSRKRAALSGGMLSVMVALALAYLLELRNPVIRTAKQMEREIGIVPVVSIPFLDARPAKPSRWHRLRAWFGNPADTGGSAV